jgi:3-deoxy-D-manno-octulosonic-acid transferase
MLFFYHLLMFGFSFSIRLASLWSEKARQWIRGRERIFERMASSIDPANGPIVWMHCASLGEFEQGRTVLESIRKEYPHFRILLTFFSPSGFEVRKNTKLADWVFYLPLDGKRNANRFLDIVQPSMAIFVKYESWFHYLYALQKRDIPSLLISAFFRKEQNFFGMMGRLLRKMLDLYDFIYVQDKISADLLKQYDIKAPHAIAGDTRFDRVNELAMQEFHHPIIEKFVANHNVIVAGSTWREDEELLLALHEQNPTLKFILAPHEVNEVHIAALKSKFKDAVFLSALEKDMEIGEENVLVIDCFGMLSKLYRFGTICYVGGGFNKAGIHNILEAAAYGKLVFFGPNHQRTAEAGELIKIGVGFSISTSQDFVKEIQHLISDQASRLALEKKAADFVESRTGATKQIMTHVSRILNSFH